MSRFKVWKDWNKHCLNHPVYKFLVLIGLTHSPSFETHRVVMNKLEQYPDYEYTVRDNKPEKPEKKSDINWGWYVVYLLMIVINSVMCSIHDFGVVSWQYWVYAWMLILCFVAGAHYKKED